MKRNRLDDSGMRRAPREELHGVLRDVRRRWRVGVALRGAAVLAAVTLMALLLAAVALQRLGFGDGAVIAARVVAYVAVAAAAVRFLLMPLFRRPPDEQVALYLEEHEPSLDAAVVSAVERERAVTQQGAGTAASALDKRVLEDAVARTRRVDRGRRVERARLRSGSLALGGVLACAVLALLLGPESLRRAARLLFLPPSSAVAAEPGARRIEVSPGNATVAKGGDQLLAAHIFGFGADSVEIVLRQRADSGAAEEQWERFLMRAADTGSAHVFRLFDVAAPTEYYVEAAGTRSAVYTLDVADLPFVRRITLVYDYPAYTGLPTDTVADGGDIVAPRGTRVQVIAHATMPVATARLVVEGRDTVALSASAENALSGELRVMREGFYRIELDGGDGRVIPGSLDYTIDVLEDAPPTVRITRPGRDSRPTSLEEVFAEVQAEDDYGVARMELVYSVNGQAERTIAMHGGRARREVTAGHTFFLEEFGLQPGDLVSYYARATDANQVDGPKTTTTDIYFMEVRPFSRQYRAAEQQGGGGGEQGQSAGALSRQQREVVAATFKVMRDRAQTGEERYRQDLSTVGLSQGRVRELTDELSQQMLQRGLISTDTILAQIARELPEAVREMRSAEEALARRDPATALPHEQRALQILQRAEAAFRETQIAQGGGGGGGGGGESNAEDLADLFELEVDRLQNQYETVPRAQQEAQAQRQVDEVMERLRELARRQQQENERMQQAMQRLQSQAGSASGGGGGAQQRRMAQEAEEMARQLERLAREQPNQGLEETARGLRDAAAAMRRSAAGDAQRGLADGASAADRLEQARRRLEQARTAGAENSVQEARRRAEQIERRQRQLAEELNRLGGMDGARRAQELADDKRELAGQVRELEAQLDAASRAARAQQPEAARRMQDAAQGIRDRRLPEKLEFTAEEVRRRGATDYARALEEQIGGDVEAIRRAVEGAAGAMADRQSGREQRALDRARDLVRSLESMAERTQQGQGSQGQGQGEQGQEQGQGQQGQGEGQGQGQGRAQGQGQQQGGGGRQSGAIQPGGGGGAPGAAGGAAPIDGRQFGREARERRQEGEALRRELAQQGVPTRDLDRLLDQLRALESQRAYDDPEELRRLQSAVVEGFKAFEFALRRAFEGEQPGRPLVGRAAQAPESYRALVEEYYRSLARPRR